MTRAVPIRGRTDGKCSSPRDRGVTFIELLVAIVLMGMCVIAILVALRASTTATISDRDNAKAFTWLQAAADEIYNADFVSCHDSPTAAATYTTEVRLEADAPDGWNETQIEVSSVEYIGRVSPSDPLSWGPGGDPNHCLDSVNCPSASPCRAQRVTLEVTMPSGTVKHLQTVKGS